MTLDAEAVFGEAARESRRDLVGKLALALARAGSEARRLSSDDQVPPPQIPRLVASRLVAAIGSELMQGVLALAEVRVPYSAAALVRQLVEVEYLTWAVRSDPADAAEWLEASRETRLARWQPGKIRQRAGRRFPNSDYHDHCEAGGHPVARPAQEILDNRHLWIEVSLYEACLHGSNAWHYLLDAFADIAPQRTVESAHQAVDMAVANWHAHDPLTRSTPGAGPPSE